MILLPYGPVMAPRPRPNQAISTSSFGWLAILPAAGWDGPTVDGVDQPVCDD